MHFKRPLISLIIAIILGAVWIISRSQDELDIPPESREQSNVEASRSLRFNQDQALLINDPSDRSSLSKMALDFESFSLEEKEAIDKLGSLLMSLRTTSNQGAFPAGLNVEITNALLGDNYGKVGFLPADYARINANGELIDKFGTPYWIHNLSSKSIEIVSAGPDKVLFTPDDISSLDE